MNVKLTNGMFFSIKPDATMTTPDLCGDDGYGRVYYSPGENNLLFNDQQQPVGFFEMQSADATLNESSVDRFSIPIKFTTTNMDNTPITRGYNTDRQTILNGLKDHVEPGYIVRPANQPNTILYVTAWGKSPDEAQHENTTLSTNIKTGIDNLIGYSRQNPNAVFLKFGPEEYKNFRQATKDGVDGYEADIFCSGAGAGASADSSANIPPAFIRKDRLTAHQAAAGEIHDDEQCASVCGEVCTNDGKGGQGPRLSAFIASAIDIGVFDNPKFPEYASQGEPFWLNNRALVYQAGSHSDEYAKVLHNNFYIGGYGYAASYDDQFGVSSTVRVKPNAPIDVTFLPFGQVFWTPQVEGPATQDGKTFSYTLNKANYNSDTISYSCYLSDAGVRIDGKCTVETDGAKLKLTYPSTAVRADSGDLKLIVQAHDEHPSDGKSVADNEVDIPLAVGQCTVPSGFAGKLTIDGSTAKAHLTWKGGSDENAYYVIGYKSDGQIGRISGLLHANSYDDEITNRHIVNGQDMYQYGIEAVCKNGDSKKTALMTVHSSPTSTCLPPTASHVQPKFNKQTDQATFNWSTLTPEGGQAINTIAVYPYSPDGKPHGNPLADNIRFDVGSWGEQVIPTPSNRYEYYLVSHCANGATSETATTIIVTSPAVK